MSTATLDQDIDTANSEGDASDYRAIHTGAIIGLLVSLVSLIYPITVGNLPDTRQAVILAVAPLAGLILSLFALKSIRANSDLYTGKPAAMLGILLAAGSLIIGSARGAYIYATEVPEGYARTSFLEMKPDEVEIAGREIVPPEVKELLGEQVFIKGYIRPDSTNNGLRKGISEFLLVRDSNDCCFGDMSKVQYYDQAAVTLAKGTTVDLSSKVFRVGGRLGIRPGNVAAGEPLLVYSLEADYIK